MKKRKITKIMLTLLVALTMVFAMAGAAMAAEGSITIEGSTDDNHLNGYEIYQIFAGDHAEVDGTNVLTNIKFGDSIDKNKIDSDQKLLGGELHGLTAADLADQLQGVDSHSESAKRFAKQIAYYLDTKPYGTKQQTTAHADVAFDNLPDGYYLIKDENKALDGAENASYTEYILVPPSWTSVTIHPKRAIPEMTKKVKDINDSDKNGLTSLQDSADWDFKDAIPYQLEGTLPDNYDAYESYYYEFYDDMSGGLTLDEYSVHVFVENGSQKSDITGGMWFL